MSPFILIAWIFFVKTDLKLVSLTMICPGTQLCLDFRVQIDIKSVKSNLKTKQKKHFDAIFFLFQCWSFAYSLNKKYKKANNKLC